jgi:ELWxxDGT repeat protein
MAQTRNHSRRWMPHLEGLESRVLLSFTPHLLKDINQLTTDGSSPGQVVALSGTEVLFAASDGVAHGRELWKSDGTGAGTQMVLDINPGSAGSRPSLLTNVNGTIFFAADDGVHGRALWRSDGTAAGTKLVKDIDPDQYYGDILLRGADVQANLDGTLFFTANDGTNGVELWRSDGTAAGTQMVMDFIPERGSFSSYLASLTNINGTLFFNADDGTHGYQLWRSNGTAAGTAVVTPGSGDSYPSLSITNVNGTVFFTADSQALYRTDGTASGTTLLATFSKSLANVTNVSGTAFFEADSGQGLELFRSDGTSAGTQLVRDHVYPAGPEGEGASYGTFANVNGTLFLQASDGTHGYELWRSDGTAAGTQLVSDINPGQASSSPVFLTNLNGTLLFRVEDSDGSQLWRSDGSAAGTQIVLDNTVGSVYGNPFPYPNAPLTNINGTLFFSMNDQSHGNELWRSDGTTAGTTIINDINKGSSSTPVLFVESGNSLFFTAEDGAHGSELWGSNGTTAGTQIVQDINPGLGSSYPNHLTDVNGTLFFTANDGAHGTELWRSDGTPAGTQIVLDINAGNTGSNSSNLTNINDILFFSANDGIHGYQLWRSNGTAAGTKMVQNISAGSGSSYPFFLTNVNGTLFFFANAGGASGLFRSDGSASGTELVFQNLFGIQPITNVKGTLFFAASDGIGNGQLWRSDGTTSGTNVVRNITPSNGHPYPEFLTNVNGTLFFDANDGTHGYELWRSDGSAGGTTLVKDINSGSGYSDPFALTNLSGELFFTADDGVHGRQVWRSDGTASGTEMLTDLNSGGSFSNPFYLTNLSGSLFFRASNGVNGVELWQSNGTAAGTRMVRDINPGLAGSYPSDLLNIQGTLVFGADDGVHGKELWVLPVNTGTSTVLTGLPDPSVFGQSATFTASVGAQAFGAGAPTGTVTFKEGSTILAANVPLTAGQAVLRTTKLSTGVHTITAIYQGDGTFAGSTAVAITHTVNADATSTAVSADVNPSSYGSVIVFTAIVRPSQPGSGTPTGTVVFKDFGNVIGTGTLSAGRATFRTASLSVGNHALTAVYSSDSNFLASTSGPYGEPVHKAATNTAVKSSLNPSVVGQAVTFTAAVRITGSPATMPTGAVVFKDGNAVLGSGALSGGQATFSTTGLALGNHVITAAYAGDGNFTGSTSGVYGQSVHSSSVASARSALPSVPDSRRLLSSFMIVAGARTAPALIPPNVDSFFATSAATIQMAPAIRLAKKASVPADDWLSSQL